MNECESERVCVCVWGGKGFMTMGIPPLRRLLAEMSEGVILLFPSLQHLCFYRMHSLLPGVSQECHWSLDVSGVIQEQQQ